MKPKSFSSPKSTIILYIVKKFSHKLNMFFTTTPYPNKKILLICLTPLFYITHPNYSPKPIETKLKISQPLLRIRRNKKTLFNNEISIFHLF